MSRTLFAASFEGPADLLAAVAEARRRGCTISDAYVPYPVHGLDEAMGIAPSRMGWACFLFRGAGAGGGAFLPGLGRGRRLAHQHRRQAVLFWQAFVPVGFEFTVLCAGLGTVATFLLTQGLLPGRRPAVPDMGATDDRFVLVLVKSGTAFDSDEVMSAMRECRAVETRGVPGGRRMTKMRALNVFLCLVLAGLWTFLAFSRPDHNRDAISAGLPQMEDPLALRTQRAFLPACRSGRPAPR